MARRPRRPRDINPDLPPSTRSEGEAPVGETVDVQPEIEPRPGSVEDTPDGGALVTLDEGESAGKTDFYDNLVGEVDQTKRNELGTNIEGWILTDRETRKARDKQYAEALRRTGLGDDAPGGAEFEGASRVVHPMLTEATIDFASKAMKELFPARGPAKDFIPGTPTKEKVDRARRKTKHLNWQLTVQMKEFRAEFEQALTQVPMGGVQYIKLGWDSRAKRPVGLFVPVDDVYLPFAATNFYTAERKIWRQQITEEEYARRLASGLYELSAEQTVPTPAAAPAETSEAAKAAARIEGKTEAAPPEPAAPGSGTGRTVYEVCCLRDDLEPGEGGEQAPAPAVSTEGSRPLAGDKLRPFVVHFEEGGKVLGIYRNWLEKDPGFEELLWIIELPFVPWRGAYPIGLTQMIGSLSGAATGALRALLDAAHINNFPGLLKLKGASKGGQSQKVKVTEVTEIEGSILQDDIRKTMMALPFKPPSMVLFNLLGFLVDAGKGVVRTTFEDLAKNSHDMPVGTTLALIEQGLTVYSAIHGRLHNAMQRILDVLCRINYMYQDDGELANEVGEVLASRSDYEGPADVVPVSDPDIFSEVQRFAQIQAVVSRSDAHPELYEPRLVEKRLLERLRIPQPEELLRKVPEPKRMNAVNENVAAVMGRPLLAFPEQDHLAHLQVHMSFMSSPFYGSSRLIAPAFLPVILGHLKEHVAFWYVSAIYISVERAVGMPPEQLMDKDEPLSREFDKLLAAASNKLIPVAEKVFKDVPGIVQKAFEFLREIQPPAPIDPTQAVAAAAQAETARKTTADQTKATALQAETARKTTADQAKETAAQAETARKVAADQADLENDARRLYQEADETAQQYADAVEERVHETELTTFREAAEDARTAAELAVRVATNESDNETAKELAMLELQYGEKFSVSTGTGINP